MSSATSELAYLSRSLKAPRIAAVSVRLADKAREGGWDYEHYLAAVLAEEVNARDSHGGTERIRAAHFPAVKTIDDFDFAVQTSVSRTTIAHLATLDFLAEAKNVVFLGPPGTGKTHLSIALGVAAARRGHRVAFATAQTWANRLGAAKRAGRLDDELERLGRIPLLIVDEVGYIPFDFAGYEKHVGLYPVPSGVDEFKAELEPYENGKSFARFPIGRPLPRDLIRRIVEYKVQENAGKATTKVE
ncbi:MAG: ATP-binding protein [Candidatus Limnocylindrales bacterium]